MANFAYMSGTGNNFLVGEYDGPVSEIQVVALVSDAEIEVDGVFVAIGHDPSTAVFKDKIKLDKDNYVITDKGGTNTSVPGIFAAGDICSYPGKLRLILSGFHEVDLASVECFKRARPNEKYRFEFTTSSKTIHDRLGKK